MSDVQTYKGSCHCQKVRFNVKVDLKELMACNCSMCGRTGARLTFVAPEAFELVSGEGAMTDYQFNKHNIHHLFCSTCGVRSFARGKKQDGSEMLAINARCLDGVDAEKIPVRHVDGKSF